MYVCMFTKKRDTILTLVLTLYEIKGYMIYENSCKNRRRLPGEGEYSHTLPIRVCAAQRGRDFEAPDLERDIHFRGVF